MNTSATRRRALVTGASRGIGQAIAAALVTAGLDVIAPTRAELDLADPSSIDTYIASMSDEPIDVLVNNAGINEIAGLADVHAERLSAVLQINLLSAFRLTQAIAPTMAARGSGHIVNLSSILGLVGRAGRSPYSITKAALNALTRSTAIEYGPKGVVANAIAPGYIETDLTHKNNSADVIAALERDIPLRRLGQVAEIAALAVFLCSTGNTYLTGQTIVIDGGYTCQ